MENTLRKPTAYVIDDDSTFCMITKINVRRINPNIEVEEFSNGQSALDKLKEEEPSILFLDINMSEINGWEFLDHFKEKPPYPIYLISSSIDPGDIRKAEEHPYVEAYLEKPLDLEKLKMAFSDLQI